MSDPRRPGPPPREPYPSFEERAYGAGPGGTQPAATAPPPLHAPPRHHDEQHHAGHHRRPRRKRRSWLASLLFLVLLGSIAVVSAGAVFLITNPPTALIRAQLIDQVKARTGRTLTIAGPTSFTVFPSLGLAMKDVTLSPPPGMTGPAFAKMAELDVSVRLLPLLKREVSINRLVLQKPVIDLRVDKNGAKSWDFAALTTPQRVPVRLAQAPRAASDAPGGLPSDAQDFLKNAGDASKKPNAKKIAELRQLQLGDVRIVDGTVRYADAKSQTRQEVEAVNVRLHLDHIAAPLGAKGDLKWRKEKINFSATLTSLEQVLQTKPAKVTINLISQPVVGSYDGTVHAGDVVAAKGVVALKSPSVRKLAHWLGSELPPAKGYGPLQLSGVLDANGNTTHLTSAKLSLDNQQAQGKITVKTGGVRPYVNANLKLSQLDLNNYLAGGPAPRPVAATQTPTTAKPAPAKKSSAPKSINDLLGDTGTRVKGYTQRSGWSKEAMNAQALGAVDADATLSIGRLFVHNLKIGQSNVQVNLKNRVMKTDLKEVNLYQGRGTGFVSLDGSTGSAVGVGANLTLSGVEALDLLKDAAGQDWLSGKGNVTLAVAGQGTSQHQIMNALNGNAKIAFNDGAIVGINIPKMIRGITQGQLSSLGGSSPAEKTDFSSMTATWAITSGVATNQDLQLLSPLMRVTGNGSVMIGQQQVDYMLRPKLVANLQGQGGGDASGLEIPVRVHGPWAKPSITPDVGSVLADPNKALKAVEQIGKQFKGKNTGEILDGLLGGGSGGNESGEKPSPAKDLLDRFLR